MNTLPSLDSMLERYRNACELKQTIQPDKMIDSTKKWLSAIIPSVQFSFEISANVAEFFTAAEDTWDDEQDGPRFMKEIDIATARLNFSKAVAKARAIWEASRNWLYGEWPRGIYDVPLLSMRLCGALETNDMQLYQNLEHLLAAFEAGLALFCISSTNKVILAPIASKVLLDEQQRLHSEDGPAYTWMDYQEYHWHGLQVSAQTILQPESLTMEQIEKQINPEVAQLMLERYRAAKQ